MRVPAWASKGLAGLVVLATVVAGEGVASATDATPSTDTTAGQTTTQSTAPPTVPPAPTGVPMPATPTSLPAGIEGLSPYLPQDSCDAVDKPGVAAFRALVLHTYPDTGSAGTSYACGSDGRVSEHYEGRAWDWSVSVSNPQQVEEVQALFHWLLAPDAAGHEAAMARRLGLMYIIWDKHILGTYRLDEGWRDYSCSGVTACHQDHVHFSFGWAGARKATSFWTGKVAPVDYGPCRVSGLSLAPATTTANPSPCPSVTVTWPAPTADDPSWLPALRSWSGATLREGSRGAPVTAVQHAIGVTADGDFGPVTLGALTAFQKAHGVPATGVTDVPTWRALLAASSSSSPSTTTEPAQPPDTSGPVTVPVSYGSVCSGTAPLTFTDVGPTGSHASAIACMAEMGIVKGDTDGRFEPGKPVTRAQMASFVTRVLTAAKVALPVNPPQPFTDVSPGSVHAVPIGQLAALGVVSGTSPTTYDPEAPVTRAQMATFLAAAWRAAVGTPLPASTTDPYTDVGADAPHGADILAVTAAHLSEGVTATTFAPGAAVSRAQMAEFLARLVELLSRSHPVVALAIAEPVDGL